VLRLEFAGEASSTLASADHMTGLTTCESVRIEETVHNSVFLGPIWACPWQANSFVSGTMIDHHIQSASIRSKNQSIHTSNSAFDWRLLPHTAFMTIPCAIPPLFSGIVLQFSLVSLVACCWRMDCGLPPFVKKHNLIVFHCRITRLNSPSIE
jgi:hypothetical protein